MLAKNPDFFHVTLFGILLQQTASKSLSKNYFPLHLFNFFTKPGSTSSKRLNKTKKTTFFFENCKESVINKAFLSKIKKYILKKIFSLDARTLTALKKHPPPHHPLT